MMTGDGEAIFIDTSVLVYASVVEAPLHLVALGEIQRIEQAGVELWLSRQVLREYLAVLSRPQTYTTPVSASILVSQVQAFEKRFRIAEDGPEVTARLLDLMEQVPIGGKQIHDANIVATMQVFGIHHLLTHNVSDFARFTHLVTVLSLPVSP